MLTKLSSLQKYGLGITALCVLWLMIPTNKINVTLADLDTIEGKIVAIQFQKEGKYLQDTALHCTLDDGRTFYANNYLHNMTQREFSETLRNAKK